MDTSDDKVKRFRSHVVKEIYETEKDYTQALEFTVEHIRSKLELKAANDNSLTESDLIKLFSNIGDLLDTHKKLVVDLNKAIGSTPSHDSPIADCYLKHENGFREYKKYGENNEHAQKILYELENDQSFKAFFVGLMLLGGKSDVSISSYLFKPIQRICKYPLLFRELLKYTPVDHSDYNSTTHALSMMKDICSVINEAKRRVERLESIADWQATVEGWEGSPVVDTCSELVKEGQLVKISAGNIQERMFFLFDNLLVYCKRGFQLRAKTEQKALHFRGRIPVANIEIENIEDGTCDYHTSRVQVNYGWKVRNLAKNKWFVLIAKTPTEKQQWMDAIRAQKDRIERARAGFAKETRTLMLDKGDKLHRRLVNEGKVLQDHRYRLRAYTKSFTGTDFSKWLIEIGEAGDGNEAVRLGQALLENGIIHHVADRHQFKNSQLIYRFRVDDGTLRLTNETLDTLAKGLRIYATIHSIFNSPVRDHRSGLRQVKTSISGSRFVDWLIEEGYFHSRDESVDFSSHLMAIGLLKHVTDDQKFKDSSSLYYQFFADAAGSEQSPVQSMDFVPIATCSCLVVMVPYDFYNKGYGFEIEDCRVSSVVSGSGAELVGVCVGQEIIGIGGQYLNGLTSPYVQCMNAIDSHKQMEASIELIVKKPNEECVKLKNEQLGFQIKGSHPAVVNKVEKGLQAAQLGMIPGCCILAVEGEDVSNCSHDKVVTAIKQSKEQKKEYLNLKIGVFGTQQLTHYQFESSDDIMMELTERVMESPYVFSIPGRLFKLYDEEARSRAKFLSQRKTSSAIEDYIVELQVQADNYRKVSNTLSNPRYPSYRPYGRTPSRTIESCPVNLHTTVMEVGPSTKTSSSPTPSLDPEGSLASSSEGYSKSVTSYCINTMAMPSLMNRTHKEEHVEILKQCQKVRDLIAKLDSVYNEITRDSELLQRLAKQEPANCDTPMMTTLPRKFRTDSFGSTSPASSPTPGYHYSAGSPNPGSRERGRSRNLSFVNPSPLVKIVLDGVSSKVSVMEELLRNTLFEEMLQKGREEVKESGSENITEEWLKKLSMLKDELANLSDEPQAIKKFADMVLTNVKDVKRNAEFFLELALAVYDNVEATDAWDRLFCHCLVAVVSGFASQLLIAAKGQLNHATEFIKDPVNASQQWLDFIAARGVLVCFRTTLLPSSASELASMKDMMALMHRLKSVSFHIKEQSDSKPSNSNLPRVVLNGNHNHLQVTFELPMNLLEYIPESLFSGEAITVYPVAFNTCLQDISADEMATKNQQEMNEASFLELKEYYRSLRQYYLGKAVTPHAHDALERTIALQGAARPLNVLEELIHHLERNIRQPKKHGTQTQIYLSELVQRMGSISILVCDSGVYRSQSCSSLDQVLFLSRGHGLQARNFRSALSTLRKTGSLPYIESRNSAERSKAFSKNSPWIYQVRDS